MAASKSAKQKSRWGKGNERYPLAADKKTIEKAHEEPGWRNGAKVYKRGGK